jgi:hypothetical protein
MFRHSAVSVQTDTPHLQFHARKDLLSQHVLLTKATVLVPRQAFFARYDDTTENWEVKRNGKFSICSLF